jgi:LPS sulfotransferase NodH
LTAVTPMLSYLVCATPRSGSTPLCHALDQTGVAGRPEEYFEALRQSGLPRRPHEYFDPLGHANIVERLAFRQMPDGSGRPNTLWHPDTYDRYLQWALEKGTTANASSARS